MRIFRRPSARRTLFVMVTLFALLVQAQSVLACQLMMDTAAGPAKTRCCGDKAKTGTGLTAQNHNCDFSHALSLKNCSSDPSLLPSVSSAQPDYNPPVHAIPSHTLVWFGQDSLPVPVGRRDSGPGHGTQTYLATLRLRV